MAAPFVAFTDDLKRFAVFPGPIMTALKPPDHPTDGAFETWTKAVPAAENVRGEGEGLWFSGNYDRAMTPGNVSDDAWVQMRVCGDLGWVLADDSHRSCEWLDANSAEFATRMRFAGPTPPDVPL